MKSRLIAFVLLLTPALLVVACGPADLEKGSGRAEPPPTSGVEVADAAQARDVALAHLRTLGAGNVPEEGLAWRERIVSPSGPLDAAENEFLAGEWSVKISYPVVAPQNVIYQVAVFSSEAGWKWKGEVRADGTVTELSSLVQLSREASQQIADDFVRNSPTFLFDGIKETLELVNSIAVSQPYSWAFEFRFESSHAGLGDRTGRVLAQVITPHLAFVTVVAGEVAYASIDDEWDMLLQEELFSRVDPDSVVVGPTGDLTGWLTEIDIVRRNDVLGRILVESHADKIVDKYWVTIRRDTEISRKTEDGEAEASFDDFETIQQVQVWFSGPVMESFPMQVDAGKIVITIEARQ